MENNIPSQAFPMINGEMWSPRYTVHPTIQFKQRSADVGMNISAITSQCTQAGGECLRWMLLRAALTVITPMHFSSLLELQSPKTLNCCAIEIEIKVHYN